MIQFFRHIRQNLLQEGKSMKYFKYAIGEIILVVVGILIALQINNWNELRKEQQLLDNIYKIVAEDLKNDIKNIEEILSIKSYYEPIFMKILDGEMTKEAYVACEKCKTIILGFPDWAMDTRGLNLLTNFVNSAARNNDTLQLKIAQFYANYQEELEGDDTLRSNDLEENISHWKKNYPWFSDYVTNRSAEGFLEYALNDQDYKNRVAEYYLLHYTIYIPILEAFQKEAREIIELIDQKDHR